MMHRKNACRSGPGTLPDRADTGPRNKPCYTQFSEARPEYFLPGGMDAGYVHARSSLRS